MCFACSRAGFFFKVIADFLATKRQQASVQFASSARRLNCNLLLLRCKSFLLISRTYQTMWTRGSHLRRPDAVLDVILCETSQHSPHLSARKPTEKHNTSQAKSSQAKPRQDKTRQHKTRQDKTRQKHLKKRHFL